MALLWAIGIMLLVSWAVAMAFLRHYAPWIHLPLVLAIATFAALYTRGRPRVKRRPA